MKGVMANDLYLTLSDWKRKISFFSFYVLIIPLILLFHCTFSYNIPVVLLYHQILGNVVGLLILAWLLIPFFATVTFVQGSSRLNNKNNFQKKQMTFPVTRQKVITAKYLLGLLYALFNTAILFVVMLCYVYIFKDISLSEGIVVVYVSFVITMITTSFCYFAYLLLNYILATFVYSIILFIGFSIVGGYIAFAGGYEITFPTSYLVGALIISISTLTISYYISVYVYSRKELN